GNVAVLTTNDGVILVDDKFERNVPEIVAKVKSITDKPIKYVINTHQHGDHTGGNHLLMTSTEIFAHKNAQANMTKDNMPGIPRVAFADELSLVLGGKQVRARHFGAGHTNGDAVIYFPTHKIVHTGDLFVRGAPYIDYSAGGSSDAWMKTIDGALSLDFDTVIPGHGAIGKRADLVKWKGDFQTMRERMKQLTRQGKTKEEVATLLKVDDLGWTIGGLFAKSLPAFYDEMARSR
ncbi:MAG: MBL fold metallo-hydrolase, partial [Acidobacteria bacterium]|nr:MBL fold metallo-hydrolase [Acidobacteriota bacterium]